MYPEALLSYEITIKDKDIEIQNLKHDFKEFQVIAKREQNMMVSAWYSLSLQSHQRNLLNKGGKIEKSSWLARQRTIMKKDSKD